jgi:drug/metabolite transporter (DMT)-like permease
VADSILKWFIPYVLLSSFNYPIAKDGLNYASPFLFMAMRYLLAAAILLAIGRRLILRRQPVILGLVTSASSFFWVLGLSVVSAGDSAVLSYTMPLFAIPMAVLILKERPMAVEVAGALVGFAGVAIYSLALVHGSLLIGVAYTLLNAFFWAVYSVYLRKLKAEDPISLVGTQFLIGSLPLVLASLYNPSVRFTQGFVLDIVYMGVFGGAVQLFLWNSMLRVERVGRLTTMAFAVPATAVAIQSVESYTFPALASIVGATLMFVGIYVSNANRFGIKLPAR